MLTAVFADLSRVFLHQQEVERRALRDLIETVPWGIIVCASSRSGHERLTSHRFTECGRRTA